jgi:hypothetical protein
MPDLMKGYQRLIKSTGHSGAFGLAIGGILTRRKLDSKVVAVALDGLTLSEIARCQKDFANSGQSEHRFLKAMHFSCRAYMCLHTSPRQKKTN